MSHHRRGLRRLLRDDSLVAEVEGDFRKSGLDERRMAMLTYAEKLTRAPGEMLPEDANALRKAGFEDTDILHICEIVSYYAYVNRIADGLGVQVETWFEDPT